MVLTAEDLPRYTELLLPTLRAVEGLGGSGSSREITSAVLDVLNPTDEALAVTYATRPKAVLLDRLDWARSYCKLGGVLDSPRRGLFLVTPLGKEIAALPDGEANERLFEIDRQVRAKRGRAEKATVDDEQSDVDDEPAELDEQILARLHCLSPTAFEEFCLYLLRQYGLELTRTSAGADEGIDGIGTAPISDVLSATVAVQAKRWDPAKAVIGRETVALFQRDAAAAGAERAVLMTLGRFSEPGRKAARQASPTVDLVDGERICELVRDKGIGLGFSVLDSWFDRFEDY